MTILTGDFVSEDLIVSFPDLVAQLCGDSYGVLKI